MSVTGLDGDASYIYARRLLTKLLRWGTSRYTHGGTVGNDLWHESDGEPGGAVLRAWQMGCTVCFYVQGMCEVARAREKEFVKLLACRWLHPSTRVRHV